MESLNNNIKIKNNVVWKFNRDIEFPKSIYRDEKNIIIRDKNNAYVFADYANKFILEPEINNILQFANNVYPCSLYDDYEYKSLNIFKPNLILSTEYYFIPILTFMILYDNYKYEMEILLFNTNEKGNFCRCTQVPSELREILAEAGSQIVRIITEKGNALPTETHVYKRERNLSNILKFLFTFKALNIKYEEKVPLDENIVLSEIIKPVMMNYLYDEIGKKNLNKEISNMTMIIRLKETSHVSLITGEEIHREED